jgi:hypothetical protein
MPWKNLPLEHDVEAPPLPPWREWNPNTVSWWRDLWRRPQASEWRTDGQSLFLLAMLHDDVFAGRLEMRKASPEIRQWEDRFGLTPKSLVSLRWRIAANAEEALDAQVVPRDQSSSAARRRRLRIVQDGGAA